jgi:hypothetical protein
MLPIYQQTQTRTAALRNIDATLARVEAVVAHVRVAAEDERAVQERTIGADCQGYLEWGEAFGVARARSRSRRRDAQWAA